MRDSVIRAAFGAELEKCECRICQAVVRALFNVWEDEYVRDRLMDIFVQHAVQCPHHKYRAHE